MLLPHITVKNSDLLSLKEHSNTINRSLSLCSSKVRKATLLTSLYSNKLCFITWCSVLWSETLISSIQLSTYLSKSHEL